MWNVDDKATGEIVSFFFDNIKQGLSKDQAMQSAKLTFIKSNSQKFAHPFYWASFVAIGNMNSLDLQRPSQLPLYLAFTTGFLLLGCLCISRFLQLL
jgi:hypothetical protein